MEPPDADAGERFTPTQLTGQGHSARRVLRRHDRHDGKRETASEQPRSTGTPDREQENMEKRKKGGSPVSRNKAAAVTTGRVQPTTSTKGCPGCQS